VCRMDGRLSHRLSCVTINDWHTTYND